MCVFQLACQGLNHDVCVLNPTHRLCCEQLCLAVGDFNMRDGEESHLLAAGWRDAWTRQHGVEEWTWSNGMNRYRFDRIFSHPARNGDMTN